MRPIHALILVTILAAPGCDTAVPEARAADGPAARGETAAQPASAPSAAEAAPPRAPAPFQEQTVDPATFDIGYTLGPQESPIAVVEFSDFGCPFCARFARTTLPILEDEYIDAGTARWRFVPVVFGFAGGQLMGSAAVCAAQQGGDELFWEVHELFYTRQQSLRGDGARPALMDWIAELGVDREALDTCIDAPETEAILQANTQAAVDWGVRGTPSFLVNGVPMSGAMPTDFFRRVFSTVMDPSGL